MGADRNILDERRLREVWNGSIVLFLLRDLCSKCQLWSRNGLDTPRLDATSVILCHESVCDVDASDVEDGASSAGVYVLKIRRLQSRMSVDFKSLLLFLE